MILVPCFECLGEPIPLSLAGDHAVLSKIVSTVSAHKLMRVRITFDYILAEQGLSMERHLDASLTSSRFRGVLQDSGQMLACQSFRAIPECGVAFQLRVHSTDQQYPVADSDPYLQRGRMETISDSRVYVSIMCSRDPSNSCATYIVYT